MTRWRFIRHWDEDRANLETYEDLSSERSLDRRQNHADVAVDLPFTVESVYGTLKTRRGGGHALQIPVNG